MAMEALDVGWKGGRIMMVELHWCWWWCKERLQW
jgi:hypothetical protein